MKLSYDVVWVGVDLYGFKMDWVPAPACRSPKVLSTDCFWQNTAGASTKTPKEQMEPQICFKPWATRRCWKSWIFPGVLRSQQQRGKNFVVLSGSIWRRQISIGASQREMVEGFLVFYVHIFVSVGSCTSSDDGLGTCTCRSPNVFSTNRCWQNTAGALILTRKEQMALQICLKPWVSRPCWKSWHFMTVRRSPQQRGKKSRMAPGRSCVGSHRSSQKRSSSAFVAAGNWKAGPKGIHADMIRAKGEKKRISDDQEDTL